MGRQGVDAAWVRGCLGTLASGTVGVCLPPHQDPPSPIGRLPTGSPAPWLPVPSEHSSTSWLQAGPVCPEGQVQMALPLTWVGAAAGALVAGVADAGVIQGGNSRPGHGGRAAGTPTAHTRLPREGPRQDSQRPCGGPYNARALPEARGRRLPRRPLLGPSLTGPTKLQCEAPRPGLTPRTPRLGAGRALTRAGRGDTRSRRRPRSWQVAPGSRRRWRPSMFSLQSAPVQPLTHTQRAAVGVVAGAAVLAGIGHELALIHVPLCSTDLRGPGRSVPPAPPPSQDLTSTRKSS